RTPKDSIRFDRDGVTFYHNNIAHTVFDVAVNQQGLDSVKHTLYNPLRQLKFGGRLWGKNLQPTETLVGKYMDTEFKGWVLKSKQAASNHSFQVALHIDQQPSISQWYSGLDKIVREAQQNSSQQKEKTRQWWKEFWKRSFIIINAGDRESPAWEIGRNYQLFRYMLACNAYGKYPTKFNGGLFTYDPS